MTALPAVPGVLRVRHVHQIGSDPTTGWHLFISYGPLAPTLAQLQTLASTLATNWNTYLAPQTSTVTTLTEIDCIDLSTAATPAGVWTGTHAGTLAGQGNAAGTCVLVNQHVARRYRGGHPRMYVPAGVAASLATRQTWAGAFVTAFNTAFGNYASSALTAVNSWGTGAALVSVSYYQGHEWKPKGDGYVKKPLPFPGGPHVDAILSQTINPVVATQRRRIRP